MGLFMPGNRTSRRIKFFVRPFVVLCICLFLFFLLAQSPFVKRMMYPVKYKDEIRVSARAFQMDPYLITAVIRVESNFHPEVSSHKGAYGLMQLMPDTAEWAVKEARFSPDFLHRLEEPAVNIHIGTWYLRMLYEQFKDRPVAAIAAYNAGPGRVERWLREHRWNGEADDLEAIPYKETRQYVRRVLHYYDKYKKAHPDLQTASPSFTEIVIHQSP